MEGGGAPVCLHPPVCFPPVAGGGGAEGGHILFGQICCTHCLNGGFVSRECSCPKEVLPTHEEKQQLLAFFRTSALVFIPRAPLHPYTLPSFSTFSSIRGWRISLAAQPFALLVNRGHKSYCSVLCWSPQLLRIQSSWPVWLNLIACLFEVELCIVGSIRCSVCLHSPPPRKWRMIS